MSETNQFNLIKKNVKNINLEEFYHALNRFVKFMKNLKRKNTIGDNLESPHSTTYLYLNKQFPKVYIFH